LILEKSEAIVLTIIGSAKISETGSDLSHCSWKLDQGNVEKNSREVLFRILFGRVIIVVYEQVQEVSEVFPLVAHIS